MLRRLTPAIVIALIIGAVYLLYLHHQIISKFEYHRWNLPSRVYSDAFPLYPGRQVPASAIHQRLRHLGYISVGSQPRHHGQYHYAGGQFAIYLHSFDYPEDKFEGYPISFSVGDGVVQDLIRRDTGEPLSLTRLEPELVASIFDQEMEDRTVVKLEQVPDDLIESIIAIEDERYYSHFGVDPIGIARAFVSNITKGGIVQGGSTLTQQLVKNIFLYPKKSFVRKFNEMIMALMMEIRYSKDEILQAYLNEIYLGQQGAASISGVAEASRYYFSKEVSQLSVAECALLAGMIRSPGYYSPFNNPKRARDRRNFVLKRLHDKKLILAQEYKQARQVPLPKKRKRDKLSNAPFFVDFVQKQLKENFPADKLRSEGLRIFTTLDMSMQRAAEKSVSDWLNRLEKDYAYLKKKAKEGKHLESALIAVQPQTGYVRAYVGGRDYTKVQFDHISDARRQPGSAFKPFVFLTALDPSRRDPPFTLSSLIDDDPFHVKAGGKRWSPKNYDKKNHGKVRLRTALEKSLNVATSRLALEVGLEHVVYTAREAGITSKLEAYPSLALGSFEVTPLELVAAYTIFPNQGVRTRPVAIRQVVTKEGEVLEKKDFQMKRIFSEDVIYLMNRLLAGVVDRGTATRARSMGLTGIAAGKTGTTTDYRDAWFVGYTPDLLALSWVGYDDNAKTQRSGSSGALPIWTNFMKQATRGRQYKDFIATPKIIVVDVDKQTGLLSKRSCGPSYEEYFIEKTEPTRFCDEPDLP